MKMCKKCKCNTDTGYDYFLEDKETHQWLNQFGEYTIDPNHPDIISFTNKKDAEQVCGVFNTMLGKNLIVTEHQFI